MKHTEHVELIGQLSNKVKAGPAAADQVSPHIQSCWTMVKRIGPAFKEVVYRDKALKDAMWERFQKAVVNLKQQQTAWEQESRRLREELSAAIDGVQLGETMADLAPVDGVRPTPAARKERLQKSSDSCNQILESFLKARGNLTPAHYRELSDRVRELRQAVQRGWDSFKGEAREVAKARAAKAASKPARKAGTKPAKHGKGAATAEDSSTPAAPSLRKLQAQLESDRFLLDHKRSELAALERSWATSTDAAQRARTEGWIAASRSIIVELEGTIAGLQAQIDSFGS